MAKARDAGQAQVKLWINLNYRQLHLEEQQGFKNASKGHSPCTSVLRVWGVFLEIDFNGCGRPRLLTKRARSRPATPEHVPSRTEVTPRDRRETFTSSFATLRDLSEQTYPPCFKKNLLTSPVKEHCAAAAQALAVTQQNEIHVRLCAPSSAKIQTCLLDGGPAGKSISEIGISISMAISFS